MTGRSTGPDADRPAGHDAHADRPAGHDAPAHNPAGHDAHAPSPDSAGYADDAALTDLLADAERTVSLLREELAARQRRRAHDQRTAAQHAEVDRLAEHLANAQVHWGHVRSFLEAALAELHDQNPRAD